MTNIVSIITAIHLAALSQIESGDNDRAVGHYNERTRYQMIPSMIYAFAGRNRSLRDIQFQPGWELDVITTRRLALSLWTHRLLDFQMRYHRNPSVPELYLLWHRPGRPTEPTVTEFERAMRFANLVRSLEAKKQ